MLSRLLSALEWRILLTALLILGAFAHAASSEGKRSFELTEAIVVDHSVRLDGVVVRDGFAPPTTAPDGRFPPHVGEPDDRSFLDGHYLMGAAPGLSILALPATALAHYVGERIAPNVWHSRFVRYGVLHLVNAWTVIIPVTLFTLLLVHRTHMRLLGDPRRATFLTFVYAFGTVSFFYGVQSNVWQVINCVTWAFIHFAVLSPAPLRASAAIALGLAAALGVSMNYFAGILLPIFGATLLLRKDWRAAVWLSLGFGVGVLPLLGYHWAVFGSPLTTPYASRIHEEGRRLMASGFQGFFLPSPIIMLRLLFDPNLGMFVYAPITILGLAGLGGIKRDRVTAFGAAGALLIPVLISGRHVDFHSGQGGFGCRYIVPMLPFVWLLVVKSLDRVSPRLFEYVAIVSVAVSTFGAMFGGKLLHLSISQFLIRGVEIPSLIWVKQVLDEFTIRRPPVHASGVVVLVALGVWLVWRRRPLLVSSPSET
jgi:hypothetical protein